MNTNPAKAEIFSKLKAIGAVVATVGYHGQGDDGGIEEINVLGRDGNPIQLEGEASPLRKVLSDFADDAISKHFDGYENNDGGVGTLTFFVEPKDKTPAGTVVLEHSWYVMNEEAADPVIL